MKSVIGQLELRPTRFKELKYANVTVGLWRIVDASTEQTVGPHYRTKVELLADLTRYAKDFGCVHGL